jgi:hypothetical protein
MTNTQNNPEPETTEREEAARAEAARQEWYNSPERSWNSSERFYTHPDSNAFITWD